MGRGGGKGLGPGLPAAFGGTGGPGLVIKSCPTLGDPTDCSPPGSSVHGISQASILEWVASSSPGDLPDPGIEPGSPAL